MATYIPEDFGPETPITSGITATVKSAGVATGYTVNGGTMKVNGGATSTTVEAGTMYVYGSAFDTTINGGTLFMKNATTTLTGATMTGGTFVQSGGIATNVNATAGTVKVSAGIFSSGTIAGAALTLYGGTVKDSIINGTFTMSAGTAAGTTINGGKFNINSGVASNTTVNNGAVTVAAGASASNIEVYFGGKVTVNGTATGVKEFGGYVEGTNVEYVANEFSGVNVTNGSATIHSGTTAKNLSLGAKANVYLLGGTLTGTLSFTGGAIYVQENSNINFNVAEAEANSDTALFGDLGSRFSIASGKTLTYTITVDDGKQNGKYMLAKNADLIANGATLILKSANWSADKTITVNGDKVVGEMDYYLTKNTYGTLILEIKGGTTKTVNTDAVVSTRVYVGESDATEETTGSYSLTVKKGTFNNTVNGGDKITVSGNSIQHNGALSTTVEGGTFNVAIGGGMLNAAKSTSNLSTVTQIGDVTLTIKGGTFTNGYVYGGNIAGKLVQASDASKNKITGKVTLKLDASSRNLSFGKNVYAGSYGQGEIGGGVEVVLTGNNNVTVSGSLWGACSRDKYEANHSASAATEQFDTYITGDRTLSFTGFNGDLSAGNIGGFNKLVCSDSDVEIVSIGSRDVALGDIRNWTFEKGGSITGNFGNNLNRDNMTFGSAGDSLTGVWTVMTNSSNTAFGGFNNLGTVTLFGQTANYSADDGCYKSTNYQLAIEGNKMQVSYLA